MKIFSFLALSFCCIMCIQSCSKDNNQDYTMTCFFAPLPVSIAPSADTTMHTFVIKNVKVPVQHSIHIGTKTYHIYFLELLTSGLDNISQNIYSPPGESNIKSFEVWFSDPKRGDTKACALPVVGDTLAHNNHFVPFNEQKLIDYISNDDNMDIKIRYSTVAPQRDTLKVNVNLAYLAHFK